MYYLVTFLGTVARLDLNFCSYVDGDIELSLGYAF